MTNAIFTWVIVGVLLALIFLISRPVGGYIQYFKECPLWHKENSES